MGGEFMSKKVVLFLLVVTLLTATLAGCGSDNSEVIGKWTVEKVNVDNNESRGNLLSLATVFEIKMIFQEGADAEFLKGGTLNVNGIGMKYRWPDAKHLEVGQANGQGSAIIFETSLSGDELSLKFQDLTLILKKK